MDLNPGCWRPGGLFRSSCLTSCVRRGLPARRGCSAQPGGGGRILRPCRAGVGWRSPKGCEVWECRGGTGQGRGVGGVAGCPQPVAMRRHPGMGAGAGGSGSSGFIPAVRRDCRRHPPGLGSPLLPTAPSGRSLELGAPQNSPFPKDPAGKPGYPRSYAWLLLQPLCRSSINTRLVSKRAGSEHRRRFKSPGPALTPGAPVPAVRRWGGGGSPPPSSPSQPGPTEGGGQKPNRRHTGITRSKWPSPSC